MNLIQLLLMFTFVSSNLAADKVFFGYFPEWGIYAMNFTVDKIPADRYTHIIYSFANISSNFEINIVDKWAALGNNQTEGNFAKLKQLKSKYPNLKTLIAVGGWTGSGLFSDTASTDANRKTFASSVKQFIDSYGFDGIDIDWEYPVSSSNGIKTRPEDKENYVQLIAELRTQLGSGAIITGALPASNNAENFDLTSLNSLFDFVTVMGYDFNGGWSTITGHQSNLYPYADGQTSITAALSFYTPFLSKEKIVLGFPMYGRGWANVTDQNDGLLQPYGFLPAGTWGEAGVFDYKAIKAFITDGDFQDFYNSSTGASWAWNEKDRVMISYDDVRVVTQKAQFVIDQGFGGMSAWQIAADDDLGEAASNQLKLNKPSGSSTTTTQTLTTTTPSSGKPKRCKKVYVYV